MGGRWDAGPGSEGPADAAGDVQVDGRPGDADGGRAEAGRPAASLEGERDVRRAVPSGRPLLQSEASHPGESGLQAAAGDAER